MQSPVEKVEAEIDKLILEAADITHQSQKNQSPSQRHIKNRRQNSNNSIRRSVSMRSNKDIVTTRPLIEEQRPTPRSRDDLDLPPSSPVPPCPPLRGEKLYNGESIYVTRDSLYAQPCNSNNICTTPRVHIMITTGSGFG